MAKNHAEGLVSKNKKNNVKGLVRNKKKNKVEGLGGGSSYVISIRTNSNKRNYTKDKLRTSGMRL